LRANFVIQFDHTCCPLACYPLKKVLYKISDAELLDVLYFVPNYLFFIVTLSFKRSRRRVRGARF